MCKLANWLRFLDPSAQLFTASQAPCSGELTGIEALRQFRSNKSLSGLKPPRLVRYMSIKEI